jgi:hypothetical protein
MADTMQGGFLRDSSGALVVVTATAARLPLQWRGGWLVDADGAVVIK